MKLQRVSIESIKGIEYLEFNAAGSLIEVSGENGAGKSSLLDAIRAVVEGGHDPSLIRLGAKKGVVKMQLDDGTTIVRTITEKASRTEITTSDGQTSSGAAVVHRGTLRIIQLRSDQSDNRDTEGPHGVLAVSDADLFAPKEIEATGASFTVPANGATDLDGLAAIREGAYNTRKALNKSVRDSEGTIAACARECQRRMAPIGRRAGRNWKQRRPT